MAALLLLLFCAPVYAHPPITVYVDGQQLAFDQQPIIQEDRTLVPMRRIFQALGAEVSWDEPTQRVTAVRGSDVIVFTIGQAGIYKNGEQIYTMPVPAQIVNDRTLVPLRAVAESLGANVAWDGDTYTVRITSGGSSTSGQTAPQNGSYAAQVRAADGTVVLTAQLKSDVLSGSSSGVSAINTAMANQLFAQGQGFLQEYEEEALAAYAAQPNGFMPYYYMGTYELTRNTDGYASFLASVTTYAGGTEQVSYSSHTYDLASGREVGLGMLVSDSQADLEALWQVSFGALIQADPDAFYPNAAARLQNNLDQIDFYLTDTGITFYITPDTIAPPEAGAVSFEIRYTF